MRTTETSAADVRFPTRQESVLPYVLQRQAATRPEAPCALYSDGTVWSYRDVALRTWGLAYQLRDRLGLERGEYLASWLPNGPEALLSWLASTSVGAVYAPFNTAYRGPQIDHALNLTRAWVLVAHVDLLERLRGLDLPHLRTIVVVGGGRYPTALSVSPFTRSGRTPGRVPARARPTLGTLGRLFGAHDVRHHRTVQGRASDLRTVRPLHRDRLPAAGSRCARPFLRVRPTLPRRSGPPVFAMLQLGGSLMIDDGFTASGFWERVRRYECTIAWMHSAMSLFLHKQPRRPDDADNPLRLAMLAPLFPGFEEFAKRFDVRVYMLYGMTEMACPFCVIDPDDVHNLGTPADPGYEVRIVDENDLEVPPGVPGELTVRHKLPWVISPGYLHEPEATARAWRNGWFHTGDVFVRDEAGNHRLMDRVKDSIRRRGEFVSAAEVERELLDMPEVTEAAVIGVAAELEEEVLAYVAVRGHDITPAKLHARLVERLSYFAVPRYLVVRDTLPRNVALRVDKPALRALGVPEDAWDAVAAGVQPTRERFTRS